MIISVCHPNWTHSCAYRSPSWRPHGRGPYLCRNDHDASADVSLIVFLPQSSCKSDLRSQGSRTTETNSPNRLGAGDSCSSRGSTHPKASHGHIPSVECGMDALVAHDALRSAPRRQNGPILAPFHLRRDPRRLPSRRRIPTTSHHRALGSNTNFTERRVVGSFGQPRTPYNPEAPSSCLPYLTRVCERALNTGPQM